MKSLLAHDRTKSIAQLSTHLDLNLPDSSIVLEACRHVQETFEPWLFNHVVQSWFFAALLARSQALKPDAEVLAVAALFHDLGLATKPDQENRFEVVGAGTAYNQIKKTDLDAIVAAFPRLEMKARMKACLC